MSHFYNVCNSVLMCCHNRLGDNYVICFYLVSLWKFNT